MQIGQGGSDDYPIDADLNRTEARPSFIVCSRQNPSFAAVCALPGVHVFSLWGCATWHVGS